MTSLCAPPLISKSIRVWVATSQWIQLSMIYNFSNGAGFGLMSAHLKPLLVIAHWIYSPRFHHGLLPSHLHRCGRQASITPNNCSGGREAASDKTACNTRPSPPCALPHHWVYSSIRNWKLPSYVALSN